MLRSVLAAIGTWVAGKTFPTGLRFVIADMLLTKGRTLVLFSEDERKRINPNLDGIPFAPSGGVRLYGLAQGERTVTHRVIKEYSYSFLGVRRSGRSVSSTELSR